MEIISSDKTFDFLGKSKLAFLLSFILIVGSGYIWFEQGASKYGIDYNGGHEIIVQFESAVNSEDIRKALKTAGVDAASVQAFEAGSNEHSIRVNATDKNGKAIDAKELKEAVLSSLSKLTDSEVKIIKTDFVGPTIGSELRQKALIAIIVGLIGILGYISYRFEFAFALGAVVALFHDVIVCMGIYLLVGHTINVATLAAALTIVGYSVNDTIIIFDRMREEIFKRKKFDLIDLMNFSISTTLSRTVITSLLTLFAALALLIFGGGAISDLSLFLVVGVITGTYSTIFIASPVALAWENFRSRKEVAS